MSKRSIRKVRHIKPALSFKLLVRQGQVKKNMEPAELTVEEAEVFERGFGALPPDLLEEMKDAHPVSDEEIPSLHVHGESCNHDH